MSDRDSLPPGLSLASVPPSPPAAPRTPSRSPAWQNGDQVSFKDAIDAVNPLHHLPIVGSVYRSATGDQIGMVPRLIGSAIFGGPIGLAITVIGSIIRGDTGQDPGEQVMAGLFGSSKNASPDEPLVASNANGKPAAPAPLALHRGSPDEPVLIAAAPQSVTTAQPAALQAAQPPAPAPNPAAKAGGLAITIPAPPPPMQAAAAAPSMPPAAKPTPASTASAMPASAAVPSGMPLTFRGTTAPTGRSQFRAETAAFQPPQAEAKTAAANEAAMPKSMQARFRTAALPQPATDGGPKTHAASDLVPAAAGKAIQREDVPTVMTQALDKYAAMMRARNSAATPAQVSVLR